MFGIPADRDRLLQKPLVDPFKDIVDGPLPMPPDPPFCTTCRRAIPDAAPGQTECLNCLGARVDPELTAAYHREREQQERRASRPDGIGAVVIESCPLPDYFAPGAAPEAADSGVWTADSGIAWESDRAAREEQERLARLAKQGDHTAWLPGQRREGI